MQVIGRRRYMTNRSIQLLQCVKLDFPNLQPPWPGNHVDCVGCHAIAYVVYWPTIKSVEKPLTVIPLCYMLYAICYIYIPNLQVFYLWCYDGVTTTSIISGEQLRVSISNWIFIHQVIKYFLYLVIRNYRENVITMRLVQGGVYISYLCEK